MRKEELKEAFDLLRASDDLVKGGLIMEKTRRSCSSKMIRRVAVCAAVLAMVVMAWLLWPKSNKPDVQMGVPTEGTMLPNTTVPLETQPKGFVAAPGIVKLYSYVRVNATGGLLEKYEVTDAIDKQSAFWIEGGYEYDIRFTFSLPTEYYTDAKVTFAVHTPYGDFRVLGDDQKSVSVGKIAHVQTNEMLRWRPKEDVEKMKEEFDPGVMYFHVLIYADDSIVGFGLIEFECTYIVDRLFYAVTLRRFRTVCYPMVDGQYQNVTEEYIWNEITKYEQAMRK